MISRSVSMRFSAGTAFLEGDTHSARLDFSTISPKTHKAMQLCAEQELVLQSPASARLETACRCLLAIISG